MRKRQIIGWTMVLVSAIVLLFSILENRHVHLGIFNGIYQILDWFSFETFFDLIFDSFESVFEFIDEYFWPLFFIVLGIALVFGARNQKREEEYIYSDYEYRKESQTKKRKFYRNLDDMKLAGVCSGLAHLLQVDPTIVRIIVLFIGLSTGGSIIFLYIILAILLPGEHLG